MVTKCLLVMLRHLSICFVFLLSCIEVNAQQLSGELLDVETSAPVPFAHVQVAGTLSGTVSNAEGKFELNTSQLGPQFELLVSVLGYESTKVIVQNQQGAFDLRIELQPSAVDLNELEVTYESPEEILTKFQAHYAENYPQGSFLSDAFYRATFNENGSFVYLLEAAVKVREFPKKKSRGFEAEIVQQRKSNDYRTESWSEAGNYLHQTLRGNPMLKLSDFLDPKTHTSYKITRVRDTHYDDQLVYVLHFEPLPGVKEALYEAVVLIKSDDYALIRADFKFDNSELKIRNLSYNRRQIHTSGASGSISYRKVGNQYYPSYFVASTAFEIISKETGDTLVKDVLENEILFTNFVKDYDEHFENPVRASGDVYKTPIDYDPDFWRKEVKVVPTDLYRKAVKDLSERENLEVQFFRHSAQSLMPETFEQSTQGRLDSILSVYHLSQLFNGVALVSNQEGIVLHKAYGYNDMEFKTPLSVDHLFDIGSNTKQFTAALILKLAEAKKLSLLDTIHRYLPNYRHAKAVTIHQLLTHTSGIPGFEYLQEEYDSAWFYQEISTLDFIDQFCSDTLDFEPGLRMEYSNSNYLVLTAILEQIEGKPYHELVEQYLLEPLNLQQIASPNDLLERKTAQGYVFSNGYVPEPQWQKSNMKGVGCFYATASDLHTWVLSQYNQSILSEESRALLFASHTYYEDYNADFGYSWAINKNTFSTSELCYFYGGTSLGFYSLVIYLPEAETSIILLNNTGSFPRLELGEALLKTLQE